MLPRSPKASGRRTNQEVKGYEVPAESKKQSFHYGTGPPTAVYWHSFARVRALSRERQPGSISSNGPPEIDVIPE